MFFYYGVIILMACLCLRDARQPFGQCDAGRPGERRIRQCESRGSTQWLCLGGQYKAAHGFQIGETHPVPGKPRPVTISCCSSLRRVE